MDESNDSAWDDMVLVGIVARAHGLRGHVVLNALTDFVEERFKVGEVLWSRIAGVVTPLRIESMRVQSGRPVVTFAGYGDVDQAQALVGSELRILESALQPLADGSYYHHQLVGCAVVTNEGVPLGTVSKVEEGAGGALLVVTGERGEILIPLAEEICTAVDVAQRQIRIAPPPGLIELNESTRREVGRASRPRRSDGGTSARSRPGEPSP